MLLSTAGTLLSSRVAADVFCSGVPTTNTRHPPCASAGSTADILTDLTAMWTMNEASGNRLDTVGTSHLVPDGGDTPVSVAGHIGDAIRLNRANTEAVSVATSSALQIGTSGYTVAFWLYIYVGGGVLGGMDAQTGVDGAWTQSIGADGSMGVTYYCVNSPFAVFTPTSILPLTSWNLVVHWYDPSTGRAYFQGNNGTIQQTSVLAGGPIVASPDGLVFGRATPPGSYVDVAIDQVRVYHRVLSVGDRTALFTEA